MYEYYRHTSNPLSGKWGLGLLAVDLVDWMTGIEGMGPIYKFSV